MKKEQIKKECANCSYYLSSIRNYNSSNPMFSLKHMQKGYSLKDCTKEEKVAFLDKLDELSQMQWIKIINSHKHGLGSEKISQESIQSSIPQIVKKDTVLIAIRFDAKKPMVGFREKDIFHILWLDRSFKLYKHG